MDEIKKISELSRTEKAALVIEALQKAGFNQSQSAQLMQVSRQHVSAVNKKIKKGTLNPLVNRAKKAVKTILEGKPIGDVREVRASDVLNAAKMVLDRSDPITVKTENTNIAISYDLKAEDRDRYKKALGIIDAEYEIVQEKPVALIEATTENINEGTTYTDTRATQNSEEVQDSEMPSTHNQSDES